MTLHTQRTAFFDLGNVVINFSHDLMCKQLATLANQNLQQLQKQLLTNPLLDQYERGEISTMALYNFFCTLYQISPPLASFTEALSAIFSVNQPMENVLLELKASGIQLIALSNTCEAHFNYAIERFPILQLFDDFILSYEVGARKPEKKIFQAALAKSTSEIKNCFYTDDIEEYVLCARKLGITAHRYTHIEQLKQSLQEHGFLTKKQRIE